MTGYKIHRSSPPWTMGWFLRIIDISSVWSDSPRLLFNYSRKKKKKRKAKQWNHRRRKEGKRREERREESLLALGFAWRGGGSAWHAFGGMCGVCRAVTLYAASRGARLAYGCRKVAALGDIAGP